MAGGYEHLPEDLPVPEDDGACDHLPGARVPSLALPATSGERVDLSSLPGTTVVYCYPMTGRPGAPLPEGWDSIPGARGCTPESCGFRDHHDEILALGARVFGLSTQDTDYQQEAKERLALPFELLSDEGLGFCRALGLPTFEVEGMVLIKRLTLVVRDGSVEHVFYPVFPPDAHAGEVVRWLSGRGAVKQ
ncbi:MAG: peroxiredoxin [Rubrobacteraceae bacterium]|uniref:peroxiredoxin n=1 Tax=Rubrobacter naiadicus TaxID=1392641 RepID=UPI00235F7F0E|nr:peroxiredoxin [Rubrobacter naiadicus]MBX6763775.1 peroxiredoxin [Rubrobacteraceae bacterium]MCL6437157.1 peroxiredoxin [Rubrobacteraceae bacterium]